MEDVNLVEVLHVHNYCVLIMHVCMSVVVVKPSLYNYIYGGGSIIMKAYLPMEMTHLGSGIWS